MNRCGKQVSCQRNPAPSRIAHSNWFHADPWLQLTNGVRTVRSRASEKVDAAPRTRRMQGRASCGSDVIIKFYGTHRAGTGSN